MRLADAIKRFGEVEGVEEITRAYYDKVRTVFRYIKDHGFAEQLEQEGWRLTDKAWDFLEATAGQEPAPTATEIMTAVLRKHGPMTWRDATDMALTEYRTFPFKRHALEAVLSRRQDLFVRDADDRYQLAEQTAADGGGVA